MAGSVLEEYLVKLGFSTDDVGYRKFVDRLHATVSLVDHDTTKMAGAFIKWQTAIVSGFAAVAASTIGLVDKVAVADEEYRLFGLSMLMNLDTAKKYKIALDALGNPSLGLVRADAELRRRFETLWRDQTTMQNSLNAEGFEKSMIKVRAVKFEITRLEVEFEYLLQSVVSGLVKAFGPQIDDWLGKLREFNDWFTTHLPEIRDKVNSYLIPVLKDTWRVLKDIGELLRAGALLFTNLVGLLSGDTSLEGTAVSFDKVSRAIVTTIGWLDKFITAITGAEIFLAHLANGVALLFAGDFKGASAEFAAAKAGLTPGSGAVVGSSVGAGIGTAVGGALGTIAAGPLGTLPGAAVGNVVGGATGGLLGWLEGKGGWQRKLATTLISPIFGAFSPLPYILRALIHDESRGNPNAVSPKGAMGLMQLMPGTAKDMGVANPFDPAQNVAGGTKYLMQMLQRFGGNLDNALMAYNWGPEKMERALKTGTAPPRAVQDYARGIERMAGITVSGTTINITQPGASVDKIEAAVNSGITKAAATRVQRNMAELQGAY